MIVIIHGLGGRRIVRFLMTTKALIGERVLKLEHVAISSRIQSSHGLQDWQLSHFQSVVVERVCTTVTPTFSRYRSIFKARFSTLRFRPTGDAEFNPFYCKDRFEDSSCHSASDGPYCLVIHSSAVVLSAIRDHFRGQTCTSSLGGACKRV